MTTFKLILRAVFLNLQSGARLVENKGNEWGSSHELLVGHYVRFGNLWIALGTIKVAEPAESEIYEIALFATEEDAKSHNKPLFRVCCDKAGPDDEADFDGNRIWYRFSDITVTHPTPVPDAISTITLEVQRSLPKVRE